MGARRRAITKKDLTLLSTETNVFLLNVPTNPIIRALEAQIDTVFQSKLSHHEEFRSQDDINLSLVIFELQVECTKYVEKIPRHVCDHDPADLNAVPTEEQANSLEAEAEESNEVTFYTLPMPKVYDGSVPSVPLAYPYNPYLVQY